MSRRCDIRLEPIAEEWVRAFVVAALRAIEKWPFRPDGLVFGTDSPVFRLRLVRGDHLAAGSRYEGDTGGLLDLAPAPRGYVTVRSWAPDGGLASVAAVATNLLAPADLATANVELSPGTLSCTAFYHAAGASPPLANLLWLRAQVDVDLGGGPLIRANVSHALVSIWLEVAEPVLVDGRWDVAVSLDVRTRWWAGPLLVLVQEYVDHALRRRYGTGLDQPLSFEQTVEIVAGAWNEAVPGLAGQSPDRLADQLLDGAVFRA